MSLLNASCSVSRFALSEKPDPVIFATIIDRLRRNSFTDIDELPEERSFGWTAFEDPLDTTFTVNPVEKGDYLAFCLRLDTRRVPPSVIKKHLALALRKEEDQNRETGKKFVSRERKRELKEQVMLRLRMRFLPVMAEFQVAWNTATSVIYVASTQQKVLDLFEELFVRTFDLHITPLSPYELATRKEGGDSSRLDCLEPLPFTRGTSPLSQSTDLMLGQEFLTWLWFRSDTGGIFNDVIGRAFTVTLERSVVVQGGEGDLVETASVSGIDSELREARMGLSTGKKVTRALLRLEREPEEWRVTLKAFDFSLGSLKAPKIETNSRDGADPDALFLEKMYLIEACAEMLDALYADFLQVRLGRLEPDHPRNSEMTRLRVWVGGA